MAGKGLNHTSISFIYYAKINVLYVWAVTCGPRTSRAAYCKSAWVFSTQFNIPSGTPASSSSSRALVAAASARLLARAASPWASASSRRLACSSTWLGLGLGLGLGRVSRPCD